MSAVTIPFEVPANPPEGEGAREGLETLFKSSSRGEEVEPPTDQERVIYKWAKFDGEKQGEIAQRLGINQSTVCRAIRRYERWIAAGGQVQEG